MDQRTYIQSQVACALIEAMGMQAENQQRGAEGNSPAFGYRDFSALIDRYGIHHNAVVTALGAEADGKR